jgi:hypothetical protein
MNATPANLADLVQKNAGCRSAQVIEVIKTVATRGDGIHTIFREVTSYWTTDGVLLAEVDPCADDVV